MAGPSPAMTRRPSESQHLAIGEQRGRTARMDEDDIVVWRPSLLTDQGDHAGEALSGIDRVEDRGLETPGELDGLDGGKVRHAIGGARMAGGARRP
jgi:hypothetical protein